MQIANVSSTLGSIGDKARFMKDDDARRSMPFASKIVAYKMAKVRPAPGMMSLLASCMHMEHSPARYPSETPSSLPWSVEI